MSPSRMVIHDISVTTAPETVTWDGTEQGFEQRFLNCIGPDCEANVSAISLGVHTGTHLDAPLHFIAGGRAVDALEPDVLVGPAQVLEIYGRDTVTALDLETAGLAADATRVLLKTDNTRRDLLRAPAFFPDYVGLAPGGAEWLVARGVRLIGIDYLSVGPYGPVNGETHRILLGAGLVIVESLDLSRVRAGTYTLIALPPRFLGLEGSPCRALLVEGAFA